MNKQILVLSASFRKGGNSDTLCDQFIKGAVEAGNRVEKIYLNDCKINFCRGCGVCNTTHKCVQHDDMAEILDKMVKADVIVMATPVYFYSMNGQMKTLIDRTVPRYEEIRNKIFISSLPLQTPVRPICKKPFRVLKGLLKTASTEPEKKGLYTEPAHGRLGTLKILPP